MLLSLCLAAHSAASHTDPSFDSPSLITTNVRCELFSNRAFRAMPTPMESPCPRLPVDASTPGTLPYSGCPPKIPSGLQNFHSSASGKNPLSASTAYSARQPWPLLRMHRSRPSHRGLLGSYLRMSSYSTRKISTSENEDPTCPRLPALIAFTMVSRSFRERSSIAVVLMGAVLVAIGKGGGVRHQAEHYLCFLQLLELPRFPVDVVHSREFAAHQVRRQEFVQQDQAPLQSIQRKNRFDAARRFRKLAYHCRGERPLERDRKSV